MGLMFSPVSGALSSKNTGGRSGLQRENTGTSFHNHNIGTAKCCPSETTKFPHMWRLQLNRDEAQKPSGKLIDVFISKVAREGNATTPYFYFPWRPEYLKLITTSTD